MRLAAIAEAKAKIEARAEQEKQTGKKPRGRPPEPPTGGVREKDQVNLTDEDSRIMKVAGGGSEQCYNAQALVATGSMLIVANEVTQAPNEKGQLVPMIEKIKALPKGLGRTQRIRADSATSLQKMAHRLKTPRGRNLYALRKQTPQPVFGIIKSVMGYRQAMLRGLENVKGERNLVSMSWNIK